MKLHFLFTLVAIFCALPASAKEASAPVVERPWLLEDEKNTINVFEKAADNVVFVGNSALMGSIFSNEVVEVPAGTGSGFVWDNKGHIVTNYHVIAKASSITVTLKNGKKYSAKVIGAEPRRDVALLKVADAKDLPQGFTSFLGDSSQLVVGQKTIAIGNPFELSHTLTTGVVSALNRSFPSPVGITIRDMIQTDAAINPGNSGGPLMDSRGYLIGMNTAILSQSGASAGVGFAVPVNTIKRIVTQLINSGKITYAGLGVDFLPPRVSKALKIDGAIIDHVLPGSAAAKAGFIGTKPRPRSEKDLGDAITAVDGQAVKDIDDLYNIIEQKQVGDIVTVEYLRQGTKKKTSVPLGKLSN